MNRFGKIFVGGVVLALGTLSVGCGDDTSAGSGGAGGEGSTGTAGDGGGATTGGPTTGPGSTASSTADTSSPASSGNTTAPASTGSGQCGTGDGTPDELGAAYRTYCEVATEIADEVCGGDNLQACLDLEDLILQAGAGCEAEQVAFFDCANGLLSEADPDGCTCDNDQLACPELGADACAAEKAAAEACDDCNG